MGPRWEEVLPLITLDLLLKMPRLTRYQNERRLIVLGR